MKSSKPIYLDYHATTPVDVRVVEAMLPFFTEHFGNPASRSHPFGWKASEAVEMARAQVAHLIGADPGEIYFTSGATEGLNMAIKGLAGTLSNKGKHIITIATEHPAVLDTVDWLSKRGFDVEKLPVDGKGMINTLQLNNAIRTDTIMVIVMWANNETGVILDIRTIGEICKKQGIAFISDGTQAVGKITIDVRLEEVDIMVLSSHKMYGPKGVGAIYISKNVKKFKSETLIHGGGHEGGYRSGTLNVPGIVGLGAAVSIFSNEDATRMLHFRDKFEMKILNSLENVEINGNINSRLSTVSNLKIMHVDSQAVMSKLRTRMAISSGSACSSANPEPSHVLLAMGLSSLEAKGSFRISFGRPTTEEEVDTASQMLIEAIEGHRAESPVWQMFKKGIDLA